MKPQTGAVWLSATTAVHFGHRYERLSLECEYFWRRRQALR